VPSNSEAITGAAGNAPTSVCVLCTITLVPTVDDCDASFATNVLQVVEFSWLTASAPQWNSIGFSLFLLIRSSGAGPRALACF
jgi:hypothetical protein